MSQNEDSCRSIDYPTMNAKILSVDDVPFETGYLAFDKIYSRILQNKQLLEKNGYTCDWSVPLDVYDFLTYDEASLNGNGYITVGDNKHGRIFTVFSKNELDFWVNIYPSSNRAAVHTSVAFDEGTITDMRLLSDSLEKLVGITLRPMYRYS